MRTTLLVQVWICPHDLNYYASSSAGDLKKQWNTDSKNRRTFPRSQCPVCGLERVMHNVEVEVERTENHA
jgi:hypothetical protein